MVMTELWVMPSRAPADERRSDDAAARTTKMFSPVHSLT